MVGTRPQINVDIVDIAHDVELMRRFQAMFLFLSLALTLTTGVSQLPRGRGRPTSEHVLAAIEIDSTLGTCNC
jgi:hypothetical protein